MIVSSDISEPRVIVRITILLGALCTMASDMVVIPILDMLANAFPSQSISIVAMAYTIAGFAFIPASLLTPWLCRRFNSKAIMLVGILMCTIFGGFGGIVPNISYIIIFHFLEGFGAGLCTNLIPIYIAALCTEKRDIIRMNAWNGAAGTSLGLIVSLLSGLLAARFGWQVSYYVFFSEILVFIVVWLYLPDLPPQPQSKQSRIHLSSRARRWLAEVFITAFFVNIMWTHQAGFLAEAGFGRADISGIASSIIEVGGFISGLIMARILKTVRSYFQNVCLLLFVISLLFMLYADNINIFYVGCILWGIGQGLYYPYLWANATMLCADIRDASSLISLTTVFWYLAVGVTSFLYSVIAEFFHNDTHSFSFIVSLVAFIILFIYRLLMGTIERKQDAVLSNTQ